MFDTLIKCLEVFGIETPSGEIVGMLAFAAIYMHI